ncbi:DUF3604 domain-containing protein [Aurantiacibacter rhizosphaerae]|uniref:DUF3604 domain-containing protein n=1 Tax=Aurantiacibacter rhizosphaerae TaxID=2691582 RepID=A0A844XGT6_9SPHN|nr:DUF3604 domain-containing protein [Aurantiacibacter rhizosphaerae]MWV29236.1 DUF3604 domain-containing protein [Aurantiacibacter rhizosphaerae]
MTLRFGLSISLALALAACSQAEPAPMNDGEVAAVTLDPAPADGDRQLLWGDTHVHSRNSTDAFASGVGSVDIDTAYRFARGIPVVFRKTGERVQIDSPLDFIVMADHAENLGINARVERGDEQVLSTSLGKSWWDILQTDGAQAMTRAIMGLSISEEERNDYLAPVLTDAIRQTSWDEQIAAAERHNRPGEFTAMIGWEWSSTPNMRNLHRVVMTNVNGDVARQFLPFSYYISDRPEDLWSFFEQTHARTGADFVGMPHNSNLSDGRMFATTDSDGDDFTVDYARRRSRWEPVAEITQYKGTSETHPQLSPTDEFADFELRNMLLTGQATAVSEGSYLRSALLNGMKEQQRLGVNPFAFGIGGASDSHTGLSSQRENRFEGKMAEDHSPAERLGPDRVASIFPNVEMSAGGLTGIWSDANDRQSIFDAFRRREVFATTGPRIGLRMFAGQNFTRSDLLSPQFGRIGYAKGVPMGGTLLPMRTGQAPQFAIVAVKDPAAANLDRVQVVKGWIDANGVAREKVFNVAWSGERSLRGDGTLADVGNTVDLATARYTNTIGAAELSTLWRDPEFDPAQPAFYYVRVLQIPTPRQHVFDALAMGIDPLTIDLPPTIRERAWSSPLWYMP